MKLMEQLLTIKQVSEILGVSKETLRIWDRNDVLPSIKTTGGHRRWRKTDIDEYMGSQEEKEIKVSEVCIYGRVSSHEQKQKGDLVIPCQRFSDYCAKKKYKVSHMLKDVGSGLSDTRKSLRKLFDLVVNRKISKVIIEHRDRLTRFQFKVFEYFFNSYDVEIVVVEKKDIEENEELVEDIMMLMASFSGKLYGRRSAKRRKKKKVE